MLGPYYKPQLTSVLSIMHRITGVFLTVVGAPLLIWWLVAVGQGAGAYATLQACMDGVLGKLALVGLLFCLSFHFFNGIRHLFWDIGKGLDLKSVYASGWVVVGASLVATALLGSLTL